MCWWAQPWPVAGLTWSWLALALSDMGELLAASQSSHLSSSPHYQNLATQAQYHVSASFYMLQINKYVYCYFYLRGKYFFKASFGGKCLPLILHRQLCDRFQYNLERHHCSTAVCTDLGPVGPPAVQFWALHFIPLTLMVPFMRCCSGAAYGMKLSENLFLFCSILLHICFAHDSELAWILFLL